MSELTEVGGKAVWKGSEIDYRAEGMRTLTAAEVDEIEAALRAAGALDFTAITAETFPLPTLGRFLRDMGEDLREGRGFLLLRGLPRHRFTTDDLARIYVGLGVHVGRLLPQSWHGELLGNVIDVSDVEAAARGYQSGGSQRFHTDTCDIVSLMCVQAAKSGGLSRIVSVGALHNRLLETRPDLLATLHDVFVCRRMELDAERGSGRLVKSLVFLSKETGQLSCNISGSYPRRAVAAGDAVMTALQEEAMDELERLASSPEFYLDMSIGEGDIQFLNNRTLLHGRTGYEDWFEIARRRHLLRLWIDVPSWPALPANQGMHGPDDHAGWLRQRTPLMELPSRYIAAISARKAAQAA